MTIHINNEPKEIPLSWSEVDFELFLKIGEAGDDLIKALSIIVGIDYEILLKAEVRNLDKVLELMGFLFTKVPIGELPKSILGYPVPQDLNFQTIGQFQDLKLLTKQFPVDETPTKDQLMTYTQICAIYCTVPYDAKQADLISNKFMKAPCQEVLAIGNFTVMKLLALRLNIPNPFQRAATRRRNFRLVLISWLSRLAFTARYYLWKRKLRTNDMNS